LLPTNSPESGAVCDNFVSEGAPKDAHDQSLTTYTRGIGAYEASLGKIGIVEPAIIDIHLPFSHIAHSNTSLSTTNHLKLAMSDICIPCERDSPNARPIERPSSTTEKSHVNHGETSPFEPNKSRIRLDILPCTVPDPQRNLHHDIRANTCRLHRLQTARPEYQNQGERHSKLTESK
jgi:hypothetical protein